MSSSRERSLSHPHAKRVWQERPAYGKLSNEQKKFVDHFSGNIKQAAKDAGISYDKALKFSKAWPVQAALKERDAYEEKKNREGPVKRRVLTRLELQEFWSKVVLDDKEVMDQRLKAADALARSKAMFVARVDVTSKGKSLAELVVESVKEARKLGDPEEGEIIDVTPSVKALDE